MYWFIPELFDLIKAAMWPAIVLTVFYFLRKPIEEIIKNIAEIKHGTTSLKFRRGLDAVENSIDLNNKRPKSSELSVIESWKKLEVALRKLAEKYRDQAKGESIYDVLFWSGIKTKEILDFLLSQEAITSQEFRDINELRVLRNSVVHQLDVKVEAADAERFSSLVEKLTKKISIKYKK